jgi:hypothetical protein
MALPRVKPVNITVGQRWRSKCVSETVVQVTEVRPFCVVVAKILEGRDKGRTIAVHRFPRFFTCINAARR